MYIVENDATLACFKLSSPIRFPTLVAAARPIDKGTIKNKLAIFIAIEWLATTVSPRIPRITAAPENILNSIEIPRPIGKPNLNTSFVVENDGKENLENGSVFL